MQARIDEFAESDLDVAAAARERIGERGWDRRGRSVDDACVAFERVAEAVVVIRQQPSGLVESDEELVGVVRGALRALRARAEPEAAGVGLEPRRCAPPPRSTSTGGTSSSRSSRTQRSVTRVRRAGRVAIRRRTVAAGADRIGASARAGEDRRASGRHPVVKPLAFGLRSASPCSRPHRHRDPRLPSLHRHRSRPPSVSPVPPPLRSATPSGLVPTRRRPLPLPPVLPAPMYRAGRGRGVQREAVDPPSSLSTGGVEAFGRRRVVAPGPLGWERHGGTGRREPAGRHAR